MPSPSLQELREEHQKRLPQLEQYARHIEALLRERLKIKGIKTHLVESRAKDTESFLTKAFKPEKSYNKPFEDITDLIGLRVIAFYEDDFPYIEELITEIFIQTKAKEDKKPESAAIFGYRSLHYIVQLNPTVVDIGEFDGVANLEFEIQVRTVLQHAWAAISHKLDYKRKNDAPDNLARKLSRLSALFEIADDEFVSLRAMSAAEEKAIDEKLGGNETGIPIDSHSLASFIENSDVIRKIYRVAHDAGFIFDRPRSGDSDALSGLIQICALADITTISHLQNELENSMVAARRYLSTQIMTNKNAGRSVWYATNTFICQLLVIQQYPKKITEEKLVELGWGSDIASQVLGVAIQYSLTSN